MTQKGPAAWQRVMKIFGTVIWICHYSQQALDDGQSDSPAEPAVSDRLLAWIFLQPYAEYLADSRPRAFGWNTLGLSAVRRQTDRWLLRPEGDGAKKSLVCMLCAHEWAFRRIYCPACGEEREPQMAFYSAPEIAHVRVDVCDTCHTYLKKHRPDEDGPRRSNRGIVG